MVEKKKKLKQNSNFTITNMAKGNPPIGGLPFLAMKEAVLGKAYELSVVFASRTTLRKLNLKYRNKNQPTDILSFPLSKTEGEIFINLEEARKEAKKFGRELENFLGLLFIHGLAHLEGLEHGSRMERIETKFRKQLGF